MDSSSGVHGAEWYGTQLNETIKEIKVKKGELQSIAEKAGVTDIDILELDLETTEALSDRTKKLAKKKFVALQELKTKETSYVELLKKPTEVYLLLFVYNAFRGKPV